MNTFKKFIRGFIIDPELEKKANEVADETLKTVKLAKETLKRAQNVQQLIALAGLGLIVAGFVAGSMSAEAGKETSTNS